ncbi:MAG TPA: DNA polymerase III subunit delta' [Pyrinomonadaceae bacterium]|nr:DNA polymerase III subunit delta' [Pyrinomonadaceae bacterium]
MNSELIGNKKIAEALKRLVVNQSVPQSMIFSGPAGIGKKLFARNLAAALICRSKNNGEACNQCSPCQRINNAQLTHSGEKAEDFDRVFFTSHPDFGLILPHKRMIRVEAIRSLEQEVNFRPFEADCRVFIIDDADRMNTQAANALLKTLEEPPSYAYLILITSRFDSLLPTIVSRCQAIRFGAIQRTEIQKYLTEKAGYSAEDAAKIAEFSDGSLADALRVDPESLEKDYALIRNALESAIFKGSILEGLNLIEKVSAGEAEDFDLFLTQLEQVLGRLLESHILQSGSANLSPNNRFSLNSDRLNQIIFEIESLRANLSVNLNRKVAGASLFVKISELSEINRN